MKLSTQLALLKARNAARGNEVPVELLHAEDFRDFMGKDEYGSKSTGLEQLDALVGLSEVKQRVREMVGFFKAQKKLYEEGKEEKAPCYHMMFTGNPGTGKTVLARILGRIFRECGLLPIGDMLEVSRLGYGRGIYRSDGPKTVSLCRSAMGSVLFIDEAYLLADNSDGTSRDYGKEAMGALIAEMENQRDRFIVILAGYENEMNKLCGLNAGLRDRCLTSFISKTIPARNCLRFSSFR
jgi:AAA+ superfamily predicted ATPase